MVSLCVLDEQWPFVFLQVYADAVVDDDRDLVVDVMMGVGARMSGQQLGDDARPVVAAMAEDEDRVVLRCRPYATFATPPRHLHRNDQESADHPLDLGQRPVGRGRFRTDARPTRARRDDHPSGAAVGKDDR